MNLILFSVIALGLTLAFLRSQEGTPMAFASADGPAPDATDQLPAIEPAFAPAFEPDQLPSALESFSVNAGQVFQQAAQSVGLANAALVPDANTAQANTKAFLDMIAFSEGTAMAEGYRAMFGYPKIPDRLIPNFINHPHQFFSFKDKAGNVNKTSAAGRYQFLARTWDALAAKLGLPDFSPESQDRACLELIRQRNALGDVEAGRVESAIAKCAPIWASLPGAGYNQPERKLSALVASYNQAGGTLEA